MTRYDEFLNSKWNSSKKYAGSIYAAENKEGFYFASKGEAFDVVYTMFAMIKSSFQSPEDMLSFVDEVEANVASDTASEGMFLAENYDGVLSVTRSRTRDEFAAICAKAVNKVAEKYELTLESLFKQLRSWISTDVEE